MLVGVEVSTAEEQKGMVGLQQVRNKRLINFGYLSGLTGVYGPLIVTPL